ncbi:MAG: camphor resistance protein CrcB [Methanomethylovorans sp. PtaU1.Bin073]|jgi:CrcB protein|nr:MAG: camphor resistance protein CrcB [Methanomethylovorans sp. PtaU1.Bin073]
MSRDWDLKDLLAIGCGGFLGAVARFMFAQSLTSVLGTLAVNVLGSFCLGLLMYHSEFLGYVPTRTRLFLGIGFLGAFTTFSSFAVYAFQMSFAASVLFICFNVIPGLLAVFLGRACMVYLGRRR